MSPESAISSPLAFPAAGFIEPGGLGAKATSTQLIICTVLIINSTRWLPALGWQRRAPEAGSSAKSFFFSIHQLMQEDEESSDNLQFAII